MVETLPRAGLASAPSKAAAATPSTKPARLTVGTGAADAFVRGEGGARLSSLLALGIATLSVPLVILVAKPGRQARAAIVLACLFSAWATWRAGGGLRMSTGSRPALTLLAAVPVLGLFVCLGVGLLALRRSGGAR